MKRVAIVSCMVLACGCATVEMSHRYPSAYVDIEPTRAAAIVRESFVPNDKAGGFFDLTWPPGVDADAWRTVVVTPETISFRAYRAGRLLSGGYPVGTFEKIYYTHSFRFDQLRLVNVWKPGWGDPRSVPGAERRGDHRVRMMWGSLFSKNDPIHNVQLYVSNDQLPQLLLAISKLAPEAPIHCNAGKLPATVVFSD